MLNCPSTFRNRIKVKAEPLNHYLRIGELLFHPLFGVNERLLEIAVCREESERFENDSHS